MSELNRLLESFLDPARVRKAISELKKIDTLLTEISRTNDRLSRSDLAGIGHNAFSAASRYGRNVTDYLAAVRDASQAGYEDAEGIAALSMAVQNACGVTSELADQLISAADQAYGMNGSVSELTRVLDGMNHITGHSTVTMEDLSAGMSGLGSTAASLGVDANEAAAALAALITVSGQGGSDAAEAFRAILLYTGQITDAENGITAKGLKRYENACKSLNVSLRETRDGVRSLRDPMTVLGELAAAYSRLGTNDSRRGGLLDSLGDSAHADQLDHLLRQWDTYETMLRQYADGTGSMAAEAENTADSWEGSLNRLSNTWTDTVGNFTDSDAIVAAANGLNGLLSVINNIAKAIGPLASIGLGVGLFSGFKNTGKHRISVRIS